MRRVLFLAALLLPAAASAQVTIASQGFEGSAADTWTVASGATYNATNGVLNTPGAGDQPANQRIRSGGFSWQNTKYNPAGTTTNTPVVLTLAPQSTAGFTNVKAIVHLSATANVTPGTPTGLDSGDYVQVSVDTGAGFPATYDLQVKGNGNAYWGYSATTVTTTAGTPVAVQVAGSGGNRAGLGDDYSTLVVDVPNGAASVALLVRAYNDSTTEHWNVDDIELVGTPTGTDTVVQFASASGAATEGDGTFALSVEIINPSATAATTAQVALTSGDPADLGGYTTRTVTFPAGSSAPQTVTLTITDDTVPEGSETFTFALQNVQGGTNASAGNTNTFSFTLNDNDYPAVVVNEIDTAQTGDDFAEFIELYDGGVGNLPLDGLVIVLFDGSDNASYLPAFDLDGYRTNANGYFVVCANAVNTPNCDFDASPDIRLIQDGADAVAVYIGNAAQFPNNTPISLTNLLDVVVYDSNNNPAPALLAAFGETETANEDANGNKNNESVQRTPDGADAYGAFTPTPGTANVVQVSQTVFDGAGWRLLSAPTQNQTVGTLAALNLVQGLPEQYPGATPNLLTASTNGSFVPAASEALALEPGRGFFWYLYDADFGPFDGGTSQSRELSTFLLTAKGAPITSPVLRAFPLSSDGFYMTGNPFARAFSTAGLTLAAGNGTLSTNVQVYNPNGGTYQVLTGDAAPWQGFFAEIAGGSAAPTFAYSYSATTAGSPPLVGRDGASVRLPLVLRGETAEGSVEDRALVLRLEADAVVAWDRHDASKLTPPQASYALVAARGDRLGTPALKAVESLPTDLETAVAIPLALQTTVAGAFTLAAADAATFPDGWTVEVRDMETGARADLLGGQTLAFTADVLADWSDRLLLVVDPHGRVVASEADVNAFEVGAVAPNPTADRARLPVRIGRTQNVRVRVFDVMGRQVAVLHDGPLAAGAEHVFGMETGALAPGTYVVRVEGADLQETRRFTVVR